MADAAVQGHDDHHEKGFFTRWFMSTNHKDIGILYLFTSGLVGFIAVAFTVYMRMELKDPGVQFMCAEGARMFSGGENCAQPNGHLWNVLITAHGILMMFFVVIPALFGGFGNYFMLVDGPCDFRGALIRCVLDPWCDQHDHDLPEHARARHDAVQGAVVCLVDLRHRLADPSGPSRLGRCDHHAADRP